MLTREFLAEKSLAYITVIITNAVLNLMSVSHWLWS